MTINQTSHRIKRTTALCGLVLVANTVDAATYNFIELGTIGGPYGYAYGINDSGQVAGVSYNADNARHATLWSNGMAIDLGTIPVPAYTTGSESYAINSSGWVAGYSTAKFTSPYLVNHAALWNNGAVTDLGSLGGEAYSYAYGINNAGKVVGYSQTVVNGGVNHATLWSNSGMTDLDTLTGGQSSYARAINDSEQIVGWSSTALGLNRATLWSNGTVKDLGTLGGGGQSYAYAINASGQIVGQSAVTTGGDHATLWHNDTKTDLGTFAGGISSYAYGINDNGDVVGYSHIATGDRATLWTNGTAVDLNTLVILGSGVYLTEARDINNFGQIIANGSNQRAYLLTPTAVPLPSAVWLFGSALAWVSFFRKRLLNESNSHVLNSRKNTVRKEPPNKFLPNWSFRPDPEG